MNYQKQGTDFLEKTGTTFEAKFVGTMPYFDGDKEPRDVYQVTLTRKGKNYSFRFGQSLNHSKGPNRSQPSAYDVLAALTKYDIGTFEDFCNENGLDMDSRKAESTYFTVQKEYQAIIRLFSDVMSDLQEIS